MLNGYCANLRMRLVVFLRAFLGGFNRHLRITLIQFTLNVCDCINVLKFRIATVDVTLYLCSTGAHKFNGEMKGLLDDS